MKASIKPALFALAAIAGVSSLSAVTVYQAPSANYVKFAAGSYDVLANTGSSVITDNGNGTLTTTAREDSAAATLSYAIDFANTGSYTLYFELTAPGGSLSVDSMFTATSLNVTPLATGGYSWNNLRQVDPTTGAGWAALSLTAGTDVAPVTRENGVTFNSSGTEYGSLVGTFDVVSGGVASLTFRPRETGLVWQNFVLSTDAGLSATDLDNLAYSSLAPVPEPSTYAAFAGALALGVAVWRRRRSAR